MDVYESWLICYETGKDLEETKGLSLDEVKKFEKRVDRHLENFMASLKPLDLNKTFTFSKLGRKTTKLERFTGQLLWHLIEEELQHRGEINALLWQDDIDPPITGWFRWKRAIKRTRNP